MCNYNIIFNLNVNHKDVLKTKKVEETNDLAQLKIRVAEVLGNEFIENSIFFDEQKDFTDFMVSSEFRHITTLILIINIFLLTKELFKINP